MSNQLCRRAVCFDGMYLLRPQAQVLFRSSISSWITMVSTPSLRAIQSITAINPSLRTARTDDWLVRHKHFIIEFVQAHSRVLQPALS